MARISETEKQKRIAENEKTINGSFQQRADYWGVDKVTLHLFYSEIVDSAKLNSIIGKDNSIKIERKGKEYIRIIDNKHCFIFSRGLNIRGVFSQLDILAEGINVVTESIAHISKRALVIASILRDEFGIDARVATAEYKYMELAYTAMYKDSVPKRPEKILMQLLSNNTTKNYTEIYPNTNFGRREPSLTIRIANESASKKSIEYIWYAKSGELMKRRNGRGIGKDYPWHIYRFEERIYDKRYIEAYFGTTKVFGSDIVTDKTIAQHIKKDIIDVLYDRYIVKYAHSIEAAQKIYRGQAKKLGKAGQVMKMLAHIHVQEEETNEIVIVDEESFMYAGGGGHNGASKISRLIDNIEKYSEDMEQSDRLRDCMCRMDGWIVEEIINNMLDAWHYALCNGLGLRMIQNENSRPEPRYHTLTYGTIPDKKHLLKQIATDPCRWHNFQIILKEG